MKYDVLSKERKNISKKMFKFLMPNNRKEIIILK